MPTHLEFDDHLAAIERGGAALAAAAGRAGLDISVPTCPAWDVRQLVTHQGMVHRWAAASLRGEKDHDTRDSVAAANTATDLLAWFAVGLDTLLATLRSAPDDAQAMVFLKDAPPPRRFWARRQAHETTIHSVDAVAATLGRWPSGADVTIPAELAADGVDELVGGFITRGKGKLRSDEPFTIGIATTDTDHTWTLHIGPESLATTVGSSDSTGPDVTDAQLTGTAAQLYLGLWNRGDEITASGRDDVLAQWRSQVRIRWS
jgi:uncharacterized protein (TIGR03083 family)